MQNSVHYSISSVFKSMLKEARVWWLNYPLKITIWCVCLQLIQTCAWSQGCAGSGSILNGSFETPLVPMFSFIPSNTPGLFWQTTAANNQIEIWGPGMGISAYSGQQFAEINASDTARLFQEINTVPCTQLSWSVAHRGRLGVDVMGVYIGTATGTQLQATCTTGTSWVVYSGTYTVPPGQTITRFEFRAISTSSGNQSIGNFIDDVQLFCSNSSFPLNPSSTDVTCNNNCDGTAAVAPGNGTFTYSWFPLSLVGQGTNTISSLCPGTYSCVVSNSSGCTANHVFNISQSVTLSTIITSTPSSCNGNNGTAGIVVSGGSGNYSYDWSPGNPTGDGSPNISGLTTGLWICNVTDISGCVTADTVVVGNAAAIQATVAVTNSQCYGGTGAATVTPFGGTGPYVFSWIPNGGNDSTAMSLFPGTYLVTVTDALGCTYVDSVTISEPPPILALTSAIDASCNLANGSVSASAFGGSGSLSYQWLNPGGPSSATWNNITQGTYTVTVTDNNGCSVSAMQFVNSSSGIVPTISSFNNISCYGMSDGTISVDVSGGTVPYSYNWFPNVSSVDSAFGLLAGLYSIIISDSLGCIDTISVQLTEPPLLSVQTISQSPGVCQGDSVFLSANASGGTPIYTYYWSPSNNTGANITVSPFGSTNYVVTATDVNGCSASTTVPIAVYPLPIVNITADNTTGCGSVCVNFQDSIVLQSGVVTNWLWDFGDNTTSVFQAPIQHCYTSSGNYTISLTVTTNDGCVQSINVSNFIQVLEMPNAAFEVIAPVTLGDSVTVFINNSTGDDMWLWNFNNATNSTSSLQSPNFTYTSTGCYEPTLVVTSLAGCSDTATMELCFDQEMTIYVPNSFTPNGDGINDLFIPICSGYTEDQYSFSIYDRWGNLIFHSETIGQGWNGSVNNVGELCQVDTYVWTLTVLNSAGNLITRIGSVNLIR